jgi:DNA repair protein RadA
LVRIAETYDCAALATNQVMASPDVFFGDPTRPVGGNVVAHTSTYRIYFKKSGKKRIARMVDSPHHPEEEVLFILGEAGVMDPEEAEKKTKKTTKKATAKKETTKKPTAKVSSAGLGVEGYDGTIITETPEVEKIIETPEAETPTETPEVETTVEPVESKADAKPDDSEPTEE